jgi:hypothetical protein
LTLMICPPLILIADELRKRLLRNRQKVVLERPIYH